METNNTLTAECIRYSYSYSHVFEHMLDPQSRVRELSIIRYLANAQILFQLEKRAKEGGKFSFWPSLLFIAYRAYRAVIMNYALALALALALAELCQQQSDFKVGAEGTNTHKNIFSSAFLAGKLEFPAKALSHWLEISHSALPLPPCCHFAGFLIIHTVFNQYARQSEHFKESHPRLHRSVAPLPVQCHFVAFCCLSSRGRGGIGTDSPE